MVCRRFHSRRHRNEHFERVLCNAPGATFPADAAVARTIRTAAVSAAALKTKAPA